MAATFVAWTETFICHKGMKQGNSFKTLSIDESCIYYIKYAYAIRDEKGRIDASLFEGVLDESLEIVSWRWTTCSTEENSSRISASPWSMYENHTLLAA